jgi:hypothetical protein
VNNGRKRLRPDTSKNGRMKKRELQLDNESLKERGRSILARLGKKSNGSADQ